MSALAGVGDLARLALRLDRVKLLVWIMALTAVTVSTSSAFEGLYPTVAERQAFALTVDVNPALRSLLGPIFDATTIGGLTAWRIGAIAGVLGGLMGHQTVMRHTRAEEEAGRLELVGAGVVGRHAPLAAAVGVACGAGALLGALCAVVLVGLGQDASGATAFGLGLAAVVWMFAGVGAVAAQLTTSARAANGIAGTVVGTAFLLRAAGDGVGSDGSAWPSWISPIGWFQQIRPFADERWWVLGLMLAFTAVTVVAAHVMVARRDIDAALLATRPGPAAASAGLRNPLALAWRLQRGQLLSWLVAAAIWGAVIGSLADGIGDLLGSNEQMARIVEALGGAQSIVDAYFGAVLSLVGLVTAAYAMQAALRLRVEEIALRAEPVLATLTTRRAWAASHLTFAVAGSALLLLASGVAMGVAYGLRVGDVAAQVPRLVGGAFVQLPATLVLAGITFALFGVLPRFTTAVWGVLAAFLLIGQLGAVLGLDQWVLNLSPFTHVPQIPGAALVWTPLLSLTLVAVTLLAGGFAGLRRRDIG